MKRLRFWMLAVVLLAGSDASHGRLPQPLHASGCPPLENQLPTSVWSVRSICDSIYAAVLASPGTIPYRVGGSFRDERIGRNLEGCMIVVSGSWSGLLGKPNPGDRIFQSLTGQGWRQETEYSADGPDGTFFMLSNGELGCFVQGRWDGGDDADSTAVPSDVYQFIIICTELDGCGGVKTGDE